MSRRGCRPTGILPDEERVWYLQHRERCELDRSSDPAERGGAPAGADDHPARRAAKRDPGVQHTRIQPKDQPGFAAKAYQPVLLGRSYRPCPRRIQREQTGACAEHSRTTTTSQRQHAEANQRYSDQR